MTASLDGITGQDRAKSQIEAWLRAGRLPHTILISGREGVGKRALALELAKVINCERGQWPACDNCSPCVKTALLEHSDLHVLLPLPPVRGRAEVAQLLTSMREASLEYLSDETVASRSNHNIPVDMIRATQREMAHTPTRGARRICLIFEADRMHQAGANSLLKILEEPPGGAVFILVTSAPDRLPPTVVSRCQRLHLQPLTRQQLKASLLASGAEEVRAEVGARFGAGSLQRAGEVLTDGFDEWRERVERFVADAIHGEDGGYWTLLDELNATKDRTQLERFLHMCGLYLRDLFLMANGAEHEVVNADRVDRLASWLAAVDGSRIEAAAIEADRAYEYLLQNVGPSLVLADLWRALRHSGEAA